METVATLGNLEVLAISGRGYWLFDEGKLVTHFGEDGALALTQKRGAEMYFVFEQGAASSCSLVEISQQGTVKTRTDACAVLKAVATQHFEELSTIAKLGEVTLYGIGGQGCWVFHGTKLKGRRGERSAVKAQTVRQGNAQRGPMLHLLVEETTARNANGPCGACDEISCEVLGVSSSGEITSLLEAGEILGGYEREGHMLDGASCGADANLASVWLEAYTTSKNGKLEAYGKYLWRWDEEKKEYVSGGFIAQKAAK